ncbi:4'-phosphopantetheinyl transferase superfamily protein [Paenibacillus sp. HB172176]|uniref:4'-phosphopantetheinyl transferase family protein n=1 Tax=Paenibacillus sp. HB172176 TaxID=2493690 RepID=UPI00143B24BB|nr:4'-phosphopantetheinyl transferase superfamily protein [Paenibacillus sp. HB172176]
MNIEIHTVCLKEGLTEEQFARLCGSLPLERQQRLKKFRRREDAERTLIGDILVRYLLRDRYGIDMAEVDFARNRYGKPYVDGREDVHFNVSHSGDWVACVLHSSAAGIDIEQIKAINLDIAQRYFAEEEVQFLFGQPDGEQLDWFYRLWTCKESGVKEEGMGLSRSLQSFSIEFHGVNEAREAGRRFRLYQPEEDYVMAVCAKQGDFPDRPELWTAQALAEVYAEFAEG